MIPLDCRHVFTFVQNLDQLRAKSFGIAIALFSETKRQTQIWQADCQEGKLNSRQRRQLLIHWCAQGHKESTLTNIWSQVKFWSKHLKLTLHNHTVLQWGLYQRQTPHLIIQHQSSPRSPTVNWQQFKPVQSLSMWTQCAYHSFCCQWNSIKSQEFSHATLAQEQSNHHVDAPAEQSKGLEFHPWTITICAIDCWHSLNFTMALGLWICWIWCNHTDRQTSHEAAVNT